MIRTRYRIDSKGTVEMLRTNPRPAVTEAARQIAARIDGDVAVDEYTTDRAAAAVTLREPTALLRQARDGVLTRAAAAVGLEVRSR